MITTTAAYPAAPLDLPPLGQTGLTDASMNNNNNNNNNNLNISETPSPVLFYSFITESTPGFKSPS